MCLITTTRQEQSLDAVVHIVEIPQLRAIAEHLYRLAFDQQTHPQAEKRLARIADTHTWTVGIGQSQSAGADAINAGIQQMVTLTRQFIDAIYVHRPDRVLFIDWQVLRLAVELARARKHDLDARIGLATHLQKRQLRRGVDFQVCLRIGH